MSVAATIELSRPGFEAVESASDGFVLNREQGSLGALAAALEVSGPGGTLALEGRRARGTVRYQGISQFGIPLLTRTRIRMDDLEMRWTPPWQPRLGAATLQPQLALSRRRIARGIRASPQSSALAETLRGTRVGTGLLATVPLGQGWSLEADAGVEWPLRQHLRVDSFGFYDEFGMRPRSRLSGHASLGVEWRAAAHWSVALMLDWERQGFGADGPRDIRRDGGEVGVANYPGSRLHLGGSTFRVRYRF